METLRELQPSLGAEESPSPSRRGPGPCQLCSECSECSWRFLRGLVPGWEKAAPGVNRWAAASAWDVIFVTCGCLKVPEGCWLRYQRPHGKL